jgi:hypothetical protein
VVRGDDQPEVVIAKAFPAALFRQGRVLVVCPAFGELGGGDVQEPLSGERRYLVGESEDVLV